MPKSDNPVTRRQYPAIRVYALPEEAAAIASNAAAANLSSSAFLLQLGLGFVPASSIDAELVHALVKLNASQARFGNLMKLWLSDDSRFDFLSPEQVRAAVESALEKSRKIQAELLAAVDGLTKFSG